jgi:hypothetical protein
MMVVDTACARIGGRVDPEPGARGAVADHRSLRQSSRHVVEISPITAACGRAAVT